MATAVVRVSIFGSCITRDVFRLFPHDAEVASYHARSSLISLMAPPLDGVDLGGRWESNFARKVVTADFRKTFLDDLAQAAPDVLILDLMSERFDLLRVRGTYVTRSWELVRSGVDERCGYQFERVSRATEAMHEAWRDASRAFAAVLRERFAGLPVILHKAYWAPSYRKGSQVRLFPVEWQYGIALRNQMLKRSHEELEQLMPDLRTIEADSRYVADPSHRWGTGSSHYEAGYYADVHEQLLTLVRKVTRAYSRL